MVATDSNGNPITWQFVAVVAGLLGIAIGGGLWLGVLSNQIGVNTGRLTKIETFMDEVRSHDADTLAREKVIEQTLQRMEMKMDAHSSGSLYKP